MEPDTEECSFIKNIPNEYKHVSCVACLVLYIYVHKYIMYKCIMYKYIMYKYIMFKYIMFKYIIYNVCNMYSSKSKQ